jgi:hypothetical protein
MFRFSVICVPLLLAAVASSYAQQQEGTSSSTSSSPQVQPASSPVPWQGPKIIEDGGYSIELLYWGNALLPSLPVMKGGASSSYPNADLNYPGVIKNTPGAMIGIPAGKQNTLRISYYRTQGRGDEASPANLNLLGTPYSQGTWIATTHRVEDVKASWDFLTFKIPAGARQLRFKTLWEAQWVRFSTNVNAPYAPISTDSSGNPISNYASETKNIIFPTFGVEAEQSPFKHFRYELKCSGFGYPHHGNLWEAEGALAVRFGKTELLLGARTFHFETSPKSDEYFTDTLSGPYVGLRYYLSHQSPE